jgi:hypothetical protein
VTDKALMVATDVATLGLFDPGKLAHTAEWPFSWFGDACAFEPEGTAGQLVAWSPASDGSFKLRVTTGALTARGAEYAWPEYEFPYAVHHGRVMVAGIDALDANTPIASAAGGTAAYYRRLKTSGCPHEDISSWLTGALETRVPARGQLMRMTPQERLPALVAMACGAA